MGSCRGNDRSHYSVSLAVSACPWRLRDTVGPPTTRTSTSTAPTPSTSTASSPSSTPTATGRCALPPPRRPPERERGAVNGCVTSPKPAGLTGWNGGDRRLRRVTMWAWSVCRSNLDELVEHWTLLEDERDLVAGKRGATRLGFRVVAEVLCPVRAVPGGPGRARRTRSSAFVARQVKVPASELGFYEWAGSTIEYHRSQIREYLGLRECSVADADKLTGWLAEPGRACRADPGRGARGAARRCRQERIEPPAAGRVNRIVRSALHSAEETWFAVIAARLRRRRSPPGCWP